MQRILLSIVLFMFLASIQGCSTPEQKAHELLRQGKYDEVVKRYPTSNAAVDARKKIAERLFNEQKYEEILADSEVYSAWVEKAKVGLAKRWFDERKFQQIVDRFPKSDLASAAKDSVVEDLYRQQKYRQVLETFPGSTTAKKIDRLHPEVRKQIQKEQREKELAEERERKVEERERRAALKRMEEQQAACRRRPSICLRLGMGSFQVRELIGSPNDINRSVFSVLGKPQVHEQWVYKTGGYYSYDMVYVYFEDGILTSWQE